MLDKQQQQQQQQTGQCSECGCSFTPPQRSNPAGGPSTCPSCQAGSSSPANVPRQHLEPHSCSVCSKTFISSAHLALHLSSHNKEKKFRCSTCSKFFHQASHLVAHKLIHSGDRPYKCTDCGKGFGRASHLKTHRRLHTGEKPFMCKYCEKKFTQKSGLLAHIRLHTGEMPYKCENCGAGFRSMAVLLSHKAQEAAAKANAASSPAPPGTQPPNEDLKCGVCCRSFVRSSYIRLHIRLNKGLRPYHCKVCNKTFVKIDTFITHCDKHLNEKKDKVEDNDNVVKPPLFIPISKIPLPESSPSQPSPPEIKPRSKAKAKSKNGL